jgi:hypothetical protein
MLTVLPQHSFLRGCRLEPVSGHEPNVTATTDILRGGERRARTGLKASAYALRIR